MPRIKIISKLRKAADGLDVNSTLQPPAYNFTGGNSGSVWGKGNYPGAQVQQQSIPLVQQQAASPQMFTPTGNVPQSMWGQQQAPAAQPYSVPKTGAWWESNADEPIQPVLDTTTTAAPNNGLPNQSTGLSKQFTGEDYDQPGYKGTKKPSVEPSPSSQSGLSKINNTIDQVATIGNIGLGYLDRQKKQKEYDNWMSQSMQPHNYYAVNTKKNRGDYDINNGMFQPDKLGYKSKGTQANNIGAMSTFARYGGSLPKAEKGRLVSGDEIVNDAFLPDMSTDIDIPNMYMDIPTAKNMYSSGTGFDPGLPLMNKSSVDNSVEALANVQAALESGYDPTKPPTAKQNVKAWNVPASKTIYGKWQVSKDERKEAYKYLPELKNNFPTFQDYDNAFLGKDSSELQQQVQDITYKKYLAPRNLQLAGGDIFAAALYHYLPAAAKLYTEGKLDLNLKPGQLFPNNKMLVNADKVNPTFGSYLNRFKKEYIRQKEHNVFEQGGENLNDTNMKVRIIDGPTEEMANGGEPQYSGQSDYGLYIGQRNLYNTMAKSPFTDAGTTVEEKPEDEESPYVLEAEGGETILRPDGSHMKINGPSHAEGGVKLNKDQAPEGSFIYSDTNKMKIKNPKILEYFGKSAKKGGITPAELAKQYDVNKYLGILKDPDTDRLSKQTAQRMVENYQKKLAELALAQESIKGFPQGIPEVAKSIVGEGQNPGGPEPNGVQEYPEGPQNKKYGGHLNKFVGGGFSGIPKDKFGLLSLLKNAGRLNTITGTPSNTNTWSTNSSNNFSNPFDNGIHLDQTYLNEGTPEHDYNTVALKNPNPGPNSNPNAAGPNPNATSTNAPAWFKPWAKANTKAGGIGPEGKSTTFDPKNPNKFYVDYDYWKRENKGKDFSSPEEFQNFIYNQVNSQDPKALDDMWNRWGTTNLGKTIPNEERTAKAFSDKFFGARTADVMGYRPKPLIGEIPDDPTPTTTTPPGVITTTTTPPGVQTTTTIPPGVVTTTTLAPGKSNNRARWTNVDKRNLLNAGMDYASLKKYHPYSATIQPVLPEFTPTDWRGYAATLQSGANKAADQLGTYGAGQGMASNLSFLAGQQAGQLGDYISKVDQYNAAGSSNVDAQRANILNQYTQYNAANRDKNFADENVYDDKYRTAERLARKGIVKSWNTGDVNAAHIYNLNEVESPYSTIDPATQQIRWNPNGGKAAWENAIRGSAPKSRYEEINDAIKLGKSSSAFSDYKGPAQTEAIMKAYGLGNAKNNQPKTSEKPLINPVPPTKRNTNNNNDDDNPMQTSKFGGGVGASFVKSVSDWYEKLNYIANPNERQRLAEAYAKKMHFGK